MLYSKKTSNMLRVISYSLNTESNKESNPFTNKTYNLSKIVFVHLQRILELLVRLERRSRTNFGDLCFEFADFY